MTKLRRLLWEKRMSQVKLAREAEMSSTNLSDALCGRMTFHPAWRRKVSAVLGVEESILFDEKGKLLADLESS